jgi:glutamate-1-semialdehyde 2,1-aminomutase
LAEKLIPGKSQLISKKPEMFAPGVWPGYYKRASGSEIVDIDGNRYLDFSIGGIGANILGYSDQDVNLAVIEAVNNGSSSSLNCYEEIDLAELFLSIHPWAEMIRYTRGGGEAMALAVRIARVHKKTDIVLFCGYHGWHDWYLAANLTDLSNLNEHLAQDLQPRGVPKNLANTSIPFRYNDLENLTELLVKHKGKVAAIVMEPTYAVEPENNYLKNVRDLANEFGVLLIFDEITSGFRIMPSGIHMKYGVAPDLAVFSKAISNGYPMGIIIGKKSVMTNTELTFVSSTSWSERIGPVSTLATIKKLTNVCDYRTLISTGQQVRNGLSNLASDYDLDLRISGLPTLFSFKFNDPQDALMRTYFTQEMLDYGFLAAGRFYAMFSHTQSQIDEYLNAARNVFQKIKMFSSNNQLRDKLRGGVLHNGIQRGGYSG